MNRGDERRRIWKQLRRKAGILCVLMLITGLLTFLFFREEEMEAATVAITEASLPSLNVSLGEDGIKINEMRGFVNWMDMLSMRDTLTPVSGENTALFSMESGGHNIEEVHFEIYSQEGFRVISNGTANDIKAMEDVTSFTVPVDVSLGEGEFGLHLTVYVGDLGPVHYYTTLMRESMPDYVTQLKFVEEFHKNTFLTSSVGELERFFNDGADTSNYGRVTLNDSVSSVMWGQMAPAQIGETKTAIVDFSDGTIGSYRLQYIVQTMEDGVPVYYHAEENFCVSGDGTTLLSYERTMNEIFNPTSARITTTRINLGIQENSDVEYRMSNNRNHIVFVNSGVLWDVSPADYSVTKIFDFADVSTPENRAIEYGIEIISVENNGDVKFSVYGYMYSGAHEGQVGIALYAYDSKKNSTTEEIFIPYNKSYEYLKEVIGKIAYIDDNGSFYLMVEDSLYYMDFIGRESIEIVSGLVNGSYVIHNEGHVIAWNENSEIYGADRIRILNLETGKDILLKAEKDYTIKAIGFIGQDFVYATAEQAEITEDAYGNPIYPAEAIVIVDENGKEKKRLEKENYYFTGILLQDNMISYEYSEKKMDGEAAVFTTAGKEQTITQKGSSSSSSAVGSVSDDRKKRCTVLNYGKTISIASELKQQTGAIYNRLDNERTITSVLHGEKYYYAYGKGRLLGMYEDAASAVLEANSTFGYVMDSDGTVVYRRGVRQYYMYLLNAKVKDGQDILQAYTEGSALDLTGATMEIALQYVGTRHPVLAWTTDGWVMIVDYDSSVIGLRYLDTNKKVTLERAKAQRLFNEGGNKFIVDLQKTL